MSEDWKVGDLAECTDNNPSPQEANAGRLEVGRIYRVAKVGIPEGSKTGIVCLAFRDLDPPPAKRGDAFMHTRFRKVKPNQQEPCEAEFITLLNRTKRSVEA